MNTSPNDAKQMIEGLYVALKDPKTDILAFFRRSYALSFDDLKALMSSVEGSENQSTKLRIYPASRNDETGEHLSLILMVEQNGKMIWDSTQPDLAQAEIQDQLFPCPTICPGGGDLFTEEEWIEMTE